MSKVNPVHYKPMWVLARIGDEFDLSVIPDAVAVSDAELIAAGVIIAAGLQAMGNDESKTRLRAGAIRAARSFYEKLQIQFAEEFRDPLNSLGCSNQQTTTDSD